MRTFTIANKEIRKLLTERNKWVIKGRKIDGEMRDIKERFDKLAIELNKCALQIDKIKDKLMPVIDKDVTPLAGCAEFEKVNSVEIKDGKLVVEVIDEVEEYIGRLREKKNKKDEPAPEAK